MGTLKSKITLTDAHGRNQRYVSNTYIWRDEIEPDSEGFLTYYAARIPPAEVDYTEDRTWGGRVVIRHIDTPHVTFQHRYSDGAEICVARAILALHEAGMNV